MMLRKIQNGFLSAIAAALVACGGDSTTPNPKGGDGPPVVAGPTVAAVQPASLAATNLAQVITIVGTGFDTSPTVTISAPSGPDLQLSGTQLSSATSTSLSMSVVLGAAGTWRVQVRNANGQSSTAMTFTVGAAVAPVIQSVSPSDLPVEATTTVTVTGSGFQRGLSLLFTRDNGAEFQLQGSSIENLTATSFSFKFLTPGRLDYGLVVVNPDGQASAGAVKLTAGPPPGPAPTIASVSPATISASSLG
ncbi:MAG TPA: IPT/TIG domain-containing protein [Gemmatimonadaceae bacterium]